MPQFIPAPAASSGGGGWTDYVVLETTDDNLTLASGDNGTIVKCLTYYVVEESNNSHNVYLPTAAVGLQFAFYASIPDEGLQSNITVIAQSGEIIVGFDGLEYQMVTLTASVALQPITSIFIAITGGWIIINPIVYNSLTDTVVYWASVIPEP